MHFGDGNNKGYKKLPCGMTEHLLPLLGAAHAFVLSQSASCARKRLQRFESGNGLNESGSGDSSLHDVHALASASSELARIAKRCALPTGEGLDACSVVEMSGNIVAAVRDAIGAIDVPLQRANAEHVVRMMCAIIRISEDAPSPTPLHVQSVVRSAKVNLIAHVQHLTDSEENSLLRKEAEHHCAALRKSLQRLATTWRRTARRHASIAILREWGDALLGLRFEGLITESDFDEMWEIASSHNRGGPAQKKAQLRLHRTLAAAMKRQSSARSDALKRAAKTVRKQRFLAARDKLESRVLAERLRWSKSALESYANLLCGMDDAVGLEPVKAHVHESIADFAGARELGESYAAQHVILYGASGTGKRTSARLIAQAVALMSVEDAKDEDLVPLEGYAADKDDDGDAAQKKQEQKSKVMIFKAGDQVTVATDYRDRKKYGNASAGPLKPGVYGTVTRSEGAMHCIVQAQDRSDFVYKTCVLRPLVEDSSSALVELNALDDLLKSVNAEKGKAYYVRIGAGRPPKLPADDEVVVKLSKEGCIAILGCETQEDAQKFLARVPSFRKNAPRMIGLDTLQARDVAAIAASILNRLGYAVGKARSRANNPEHTRAQALIAAAETRTKSRRAIFLARKAAVKGAKVDANFLEHILRETYDASTLRERNAHLASEFCRRAIARKNVRVANHMLAPMAVVPLRLVLTPEDFNAHMLSESERTLRRIDIEAELQRLQGWGKEDEEGSPRHFLARVRRVLLQSDEEQRRGMSWHVTITGDDGVGKTLLARIYTKLLRAYGINVSDAAEECTASELLTMGADEAMNVFSSAQGSTLTVEAAEELIEGANARRIVAHMQSQEAPTIIAVGTKDGIWKLLRGRSSLASLFDHRVHVKPHTFTELASIARAHGASESHDFEDGLEKKLAKHLKDMHPSGKLPGDARAAKKLVEQAIVKASERGYAVISADSGEKATVRGQLIASDFGIGTSIGHAKLMVEIDREIDDLIGMEEVKAWFIELKKMARYVKATGDRSVLNQSLNMVITGAPGVGKTTFSRLLHRFMYAHGILRKNAFVERNALELKGQYVGDTAPKVKDTIAEAMGGCLFLDEMYALADGGGMGGESDSFSKEVIRTLLTEIENNRTSLMVILAGYANKMGTLLRMDPGLDRRFPVRLHLPNYSAVQIAKICRLVCRKRFGKTFGADGDALEMSLANHIESFHRREMPTHNGGLAVRLAEDAVKAFTVRLADRFAADGTTSDESSSGVLIGADFGIGDRPSIGEAQSKKEDIEREISNLVGMAAAKEFFSEIRTNAMYVEAGGSMEAIKSWKNIVITGAPGTGKSTLARLIARYMHAYGVLERDVIVEKNILQLKAPYTGQTVHLVKETIADSMGGCLFLDEAYSIVEGGGDKFGREVIRTLLTEIEANKGNFLVIMAGYRGKMEAFLDHPSCDGLKRRFSKAINLDNYTGHQLAQITQRMAAKRGFLLCGGDLAELGAHIERRYGEDSLFGSGAMAEQNAGLASTIIQNAIYHLAKRSLAAGNVETKTFEMVDLTYSGLNAKVHASSATSKKSAKFEEEGAPSGHVVPPTPPLPGAAPMRVRLRPPDGGNVAERTQQVGATQTAAAPAVVESSNEISEEQMLEGLDDIGTCPDSYSWVRGRYASDLCGVCKCACYDGFRCTGGTHFVCADCVLKAVEEKAE